MKIFRDISLAVLISSIFVVLYFDNKCKIKVSTNGIYHERGSYYYEHMEHFQCFQSEVNAEMQGYRKSKN